MWNVDSLSFLSNYRKFLRLHKNLKNNLQTKKLKLLLNNYKFNLILSLKNIYKLQLKKNNF